MSCLATSLSAGRLVPCLAPTPHWAGHLDGMACPLGMTLSCTKGWSPGAPSRTAGKCCHPGRLGGGGTKCRAPTEGWGAQGPGGFLQLFGVHSLAFKALLRQASAKLTGLTIAPRSPLSPAPKLLPCPHFPKQHPSSRPLAILSLLLDWPPSPSVMPPTSPVFCPFIQPSARPAASRRLVN